MGNPVGTKCPLTGGAWPMAWLVAFLLGPGAAALSAGGRPRCAYPARGRAPPPRARPLAPRLCAHARSPRPAGLGEQSVIDALEAMKRGEMVVVTDDEDRENEGDLIMAAEHATPDALAFMVRHTSGVLCVSLDSDRVDELKLPPMVGQNEDPKGTAFTVSVDARYGTTTGISASDRAETLRRLANPESVAEDFVRPGHIFPLRARKHGVLARQGHTEAALDMCTLAGLRPAGVLCEIVSADGRSMARMPELIKFAEEHQLAMTTITDLVAYRLRHDTLVERVGMPARMPTKYGMFEAHAFRSVTDNVEHIALCKGGPWDGTDAEPLLVRVHSECCTGDVFGSLRCDCGTQLEAALRRIESEGRGCLLYLRGQEGRGIGLAHKIRAYALQDKGRDTVQANVDLGLPVDSRDYGVGAQVLRSLGVTSMKLMTNNPAKYAGLSGYGLSIAERVPCMTSVNAENVFYLRTKQQKMGHWLPVDFDALIESGVGDGAVDGHPLPTNLVDAHSQLQALAKDLEEARAEVARLTAIHSKEGTNGIQRPLNGQRVPPAALRSPEEPPAFSV